MNEGDYVNDVAGLYALPLGAAVLEALTEEDVVMGWRQAIIQKIFFGDSSFCTPGVEQHIRPENVALPARIIYIPEVSND